MLDVTRCSFSSTMAIHKITQNMFLFSIIRETSSAFVTQGVIIEYRLQYSMVVSCYYSMPHRTLLFSKKDKDSHASSKFHNNDYYRSKARLNAQSASHAH